MFLSSIKIILNSAKNVRVPQTINNVIKSVLLCTFSICKMVWKRLVLEMVGNVEVSMIEIGGINGYKLW